MPTHRSRPRKLGQIEAWLRSSDFASCSNRAYKRPPLFRPSHSSLASGLRVLACMRTCGVSRYPFEVSYQPSEQYAVLFKGQARDEQPGQASCTCCCRNALMFPPSLSKQQRALWHKLAQDVNLQSQSEVHSTQNAERSHSGVHGAVYYDHVACPCG